MSEHSGKINYMFYLEVEYFLEVSMDLQRTKVAVR